MNFRFTIANCQFMQGLDLVVLGPQASSPARVKKDQFGVNLWWLRWTRAGEDACVPGRRSKKQKSEIGNRQSEMK